ncbi:uncharacterized protein LOC131949112 [Physella acuta]|uniref:uncharacterized protein LOC131949112 n=1 Tax=Physella acuta TaxID=109671 RepID=UPI0027DD6CA5|nr:uncharacterized protein LOC131949112 [Physella acuta]
MSKTLQQRLSHIDQLLQIMNQKSESREEKLKQIDVLQKSVLKLTGDIHALANQHVKYSTVGFVASGRPLVVGVYGLLGLSKRLSYTNVENKGNHFNPNKGVFTAPVDGVYIVSLRIRSTGNKVWIKHTSGNTVSQPVYIETNELLNEVSSTTGVWMTTGDEMFSYSNSDHFDCIHFSCFLLGI